MCRVNANRCFVCSKETSNVQANGTVEFNVSLMHPLPSPKSTPPLRSKLPSRKLTGTVELLNSPPELSNFILYTMQMTLNKHNFILLQKQLDLPAFSAVSKSIQSATRLTALCPDCLSRVFMHVLHSAQKFCVQILYIGKVTFSTLDWSIPTHFANLPYCIKIDLCSREH